MATESLKIDYDRLLTVRSAAQSFINTHPDRTKLHYACEKFLAKTKRHFEEYADKENEIRVDHAMLENKKFVYDEDKKGNRFMAVDPTKAKDQQKKMRELNRTEIEIENPHFATEIPDDLEAGWYPLFLGVIIKDDPIEAKEANVLVEQNGAQ